MQRNPHSVSTGCLDRFSREDFTFIESCLSGYPPRGASADDFLLSLLEDRDSLLAILEQDVVFQNVVEIPFPLSISPELYFFVLVRRSLVDAGITNVEIADYVAATLADHATNTLKGSLPQRPDLDFSYHVDFIEAMEGLSAYEKFFLQVQCGNQFLVLTGLFPRFLEHRSARRGAPSLGYYDQVARSAFYTAGSHPLADEFALARLYPELAECFIETRHALNRMAEEYLFLGS